jgi:hypothetical protein
MRPHSHSAVDGLHQARQVALKSIKVQQQRGCIDVFDRVARLGGLP